jgi:GrpB-like predicted nucleotidyltransferase (UPF0157 family)/2'-5' RNA ligase
MAHVRCLIHLGLIQEFRMRGDEKNVAEIAGYGAALMLQVTDQDWQVVHEQVHALTHPLHVTIAYLQLPDEESAKRATALGSAFLEKKLHVNSYTFCVKACQVLFGKITALVPAQAMVAVLKKLNQELEEYLVAEGFALNHETTNDTYTPHITLSRRIFESAELQAVNQALAHGLCLKLGTVGVLVKPIIKRDQTRELGRSAGMVDLKKLDESIEIIEYTSELLEWFAQEVGALKRVFAPERLVSLEHYGSSSVPGLVTKPIVDILVGLSDFALLDDEIKNLEQLGYEYIGQLHPSVERFFLRKRGVKNFNLGIVHFDSPEWHDNLVTRDYLRAHPDEVRRYATIKREAVRKGLKTLIDYHHYKDAFVKGLQERAKQWKTAKS